MFALALGACAEVEIHRIVRPSPSSHGGTDAAVRNLREAEMNRQWQDKPLGELLAALGPPRLVLSIPSGGMPPSFAIVYGSDANSGCIDAFAVTSVGQPQVRVYHCR